jgi:hypothetical protein
METKWSKEALMRGIDHYSLETLREYFRRSEFSWVSKMINEIYDDINSIDEISNKYKVEFEDGGSSSLIITSASYRHDDGKFHIWLSDDTIDDLQNNKNKEQLIREIELFLEHEDTHKQQDQLNHSKQDYYSDFNPNKWEEVKKYLSQFQEIPAFARSVAKELFRAGYTEKDVPNIKNIHLTQMANNIINSYFKIGGKILQQFLKEIINWFSEPYAGTKEDYKKWLKDHRA